MTKVDTTEPIDILIGGNMHVLHGMRRVVRVLAVVSALEIVLFGGFVYTLSVARAASTQEVCHRANEGRAGAIVLWTSTLGPPPSPPAAGAPAADVAAYEAKVADRDTFVADLHRYFDPIRC